MTLLARHFICCHTQRLLRHLLPLLVIAQCPVDAIAARHPAPLLIYGQPVEIVDGALHFSGRITHNGPNAISSAVGTLQLSARSVRWPRAKTPTYVCHHAALSGSLNYVNVGPAPPRLTLSKGVFEIANFRWKAFLLHHISGLISYQRETLTVKSCHGMFNHHPWMLTASYQPVTGTVQVWLHATGINQQRIFQFFAPSKLDVVGPANLTAEFIWKPHRRPIGHLTIRASGPGLLKIKNVPILTRRVVNAYGRRMAALMMEDLRDYPFVSETLTAQETAKGMQIRFLFIRGKGNPQKLKPHLIKIDGQKVMYRPRDLKSYSSTILLPNTGIRKLYNLAHEFTHPDIH